jgi:uncharacterized cupin superfamily protein
MTTTTTISRGHVDTPIEEPYDGFDAVLAGEPNARVSWLRTGSAGEGMLYTGMFVLEPSVIRYTFAGDESFQVLDGDLDIAIDGGDVVTLGPGDLVSFPKGARSTWTVRATLRKFFVISG